MIQIQHGADLTSFNVVIDDILNENDIMFNAGT